LTATPFAVRVVEGIVVVVVVVELAEVGGGLVLLVVLWPDGDPAGAEVVVELRDVDVAGSEPKVRLAGLV